MSLRKPLFSLLRTQLRPTCQQTRAQSVAVLGAPFSEGQKRRGVEHGPKVIRDAGLMERLAGLDYTVHDFGDLTFHYPEHDESYLNINSPRTVGAANKKLAGAVNRAVGSGHTLVMLGGDHSLAIGSVGGHAEQCPDLCLIWVDAHADVNTPMTSPSGNLHGLPVAFMLKELQDKMPDIPGFSWTKPFLKSRDLVYIGLRDVDPGEHHILKNLGIQYFTMRDIDRLGIQRVMEVTLDHLLSRKQRPIHLSYDIDAFDPSLAPATGTPVPGGLTYREGIYITEEIHNTGGRTEQLRKMCTQYNRLMAKYELFKTLFGLLSVIDLVEVNPILGANPEAVESTASLAVDVIASSLGQTREGAHSSMDEIPAVKEDSEQLRL